MENYWRNYGFTQDPFSGQMQVSFIPKSWEEYLDLLPQFTRFCNTLLIITGNDHIGKTTLLNLFLSRMPGEFDSIFISASTCQHPAQLLQLLSEKYGAPYDANSTLAVSEQLDEQLSYLKLNKQNRLLIIDDAQELPVELRQACLQIVQQQDALNTCLPVILLGAPIVAEQFHALLTPTTASECLHVIEMTPFTKAETREYLEHVCQAASGRKAIFPFTEQDIEAIYAASQGLIGRINDTARDILMNKEQTHFNWHQLFRGKVAWWTLTIVVIIILLFVYRAVNQREQASLTQPIPARSIQPVPVDTTPASPVPADKDYQTGDTVVKETNQSNSAPTTPDNGGASQQSPVQTQSAPAQATQPGASAASTTAPSQTPAPVTDLNPPANAESTAPIPVNPVTAQPAPATKSTATSAAKKVTQNKPMTATERQQYFDTVMNKKLAIQKQQVAKVNPNFYTIQFLGAKDIKTAARFIADNQLQATAKVVKIRSNGQDWYIVIYGQFPNQAAAKQGIAKLSPKLKKLKPWTRSYKSIQEVMK